MSLDRSSTVNESGSVRLLISADMNSDSYPYFPQLDEAIGARLSSCGHHLPLRISNLNANIDKRP